MYTIELDRNEFLDLLGYRLKHPDVKSIDAHGLLEQPIKSGSVLGIWHDEPVLPDTLPPVFAVHDASLDEFFAFTATYVTSFFPFTAFFRVVPQSEFQLVLRRSRAGPLRQNVLSGFVGAIVADAFVQARERITSVEKLTIPACLSSLSNTVAQAYAAHYDPSAAATLGKRWHAVRSLISERPQPLAVEPSLISSIWELIGLAINPELTKARKESVSGFSEMQLDLLLDALEHYHTRGVLSSRIINRMGARYSDVVRSLEQMDSSKEAMVRSFQDFARYVINEVSADKRLQEFAVAYLLVRLGGSSIRYLPLAGTVVEQLPGTPIWFGFLSGMAETSDVLSSNGCLGRRVLKYIGGAGDLFHDPRRDISFHEFHTIHRNGARDIAFRTEHLTQVAVELLPDAVGYFRVTREIREAERSIQHPLRYEHLRELQFHLERATSLAQRLVGESQQDLFRTSPEGDRDMGKRRGTRRKS